MKNIKIYIVLTIAILISLASCVRHNYEVPGEKAYSYDYTKDTSITGLMTIKDLKDMYGTASVIDTSVVVKGIVISDDSHGNFYKQIVIQDNTAGILINANVYDIHRVSNYPVGQLVYVKCKGLQISKARGVTELNYVSNGNFIDLPQDAVKEFILKSDGGVPITPRVLKISEVHDSLVSTLVMFQNVEFIDDDIEKTYGSSSETYAERTIIDFPENTIKVTTSKYTDFVDTEIPDYNGYIVGILIDHDGTKQIYLRSPEEVVMEGPRITREVLFEEDFIASDTLNTFTQKSILGSKKWEKNNYSGETFAKISGYGNGVNEDWLISPSIDLSGISNAILIFKHAVGYLSNWDDMTVWVSDDYDGDSNPNEQGTWKKLSGYNNPVPTTSNWSSFESSGAIDLDEYVGKSNVRIAFKYTCGTSGAATWEVANVKVLVQ